MARPLRIEQPGASYHITARGNERKAIYRDDRDRQHFRDLLAEMASRYRVRVHCFVLMGQVIACVGKVKRAKWADFRERHGDSGQQLVMDWGRRAGGLKLAELARAVGVKEYAAVGMALTRYEKRLRKDRSLEKEFRQASKMLKIEI